MAAVMSFRLFLAAYVSRSCLGSVVLYVLQHILPFLCLSGRACARLICER